MPEDLCDIKSQLMPSHIFMPDVNANANEVIDNVLAAFASANIAILTCSVKPRNIKRQPREKDPKSISKSSNDSNHTKEIQFAADCQSCNFTALHCLPVQNSVWRNRRNK